MDSALVRKYLIKGLIGCLLAAAGIAILSILVGSMTDIAWRALATVGIAALHVLAVLGIISIPPHQAPADTLSNKRAIANSMIVNVTLFLVSANFFTCTLGVWDIISTETVFKFLWAFIVILAAVLIARPIYDTEIVNPKLHNYAIAAYALLGTLAALYIGTVFEPTLHNLGNGFYGRLLSALLVAFMTLIFIMAIMQRLYMQNHPELAAKTVTSPSGKQGLPPVLIVLLCILALFLLPTFLAILSQIFRLSLNY